jgi:hypothetical protein
MKRTCNYDAQWSSLESSIWGWYFHDRNRNNLNGQTRWDSCLCERHGCVADDIFGLIEFLNSISDALDILSRAYLSMKIIHEVETQQSVAFLNVRVLWWTNRSMDIRDHDLQEDKIDWSNGQLEFIRFNQFVEASLAWIVWDNEQS